MFIILTVSIILLSCNDHSSKPEGEPGHDHTEFPSQIVEQVSYLDVKITDNFWRPRIDKNLSIGIWAALKEGSNDIDNFDIAAGKSNKKYTGGGSNDSNVYKIIQGAAYALHDTPDKELETTIDVLIDRIVAAQQPDGYLSTYWTVKDLSKRWTHIYRQFELYCAGHLFEAAAAYYEATGKRKFLDAAILYANHIDSVFGPNKCREVFSHEEIELGLLKLYKITGEKRYLELSAFFIDERGNPERMKADLITPPDGDPNAGTPHRWRPPSYMQDHLPISKQFYAVGHAVCATYLYSAVTDLTIEKETSKYLPALDSIWNDIVNKKLYITGGIGTRQFHNEGFGSDYLLPVDQAYCETCANIGLTFWNRRMCLLHGETKYADLVELSMYNAALAGVSLSGDRFFYTNPLESKGKSIRRPWDDPPCCPTNIVRFLPDVGSNIYGKTDQALYINQFIGNEAKITLGGQEVSLIMETDYPWDGRIKLEVYPEGSADLTLHIRIPGWAQGELLPGNLYHYIKDEKLPEKVLLKVNGKELNKIQLHMGYAVIQRKWEPGDIVELFLPMEVRVIAGNPKVESTNGKGVLMRGPLVYCVEEIDNEAFFDEGNEELTLSDGFIAEYREDLLGGVITITGNTSSDHSSLTAIPYYAWANRGLGHMKVWLPFQLN